VQGSGEWAMDHWAAGSRRGAEGLRQRAWERKVGDESVPWEERVRGCASLGSGPAGSWWPLCARTVERASEAGRRGIGAACGTGWATRGAGERGVQPRVLAWQEVSVRERCGWEQPTAAARWGRGIRQRRGERCARSAERARLGCGRRELGQGAGARGGARPRERESTGGLLKAPGSWAERCC
jgi:hypothetical protein